MSDDISNQFRQLDGDSRVEAMTRMIKICSFEQTMKFVEKLEGILYKDFISLLPDSHVQKILFYLTVEDAVNCTRVSKNWNKVVESCSSFWKHQAQVLGLSDYYIAEHLNRPGSSGLQHLCISSVTHRNYIKSLQPHLKVVASRPSSSIYMYAGNAIILRYTETGGTAKIFIERITLPYSLVEIAVFDVLPLSGRVKWVSSSDEYVLWKQMGGGWRGYDITSVDSELEQWVDEPGLQGFNSIAFCHCCHLVGILSEAEDDAEVWDLQVVKLNKRKSTVRKMVYPLPLERVQNPWEKKRHFLGGDIALLSDSSERDKAGFCQSHRIFLQVDSKLVLHRLKAVPVSERLLLVHHLLPDARLSKPLHIFSPRASEEKLDLFLECQVSKGRPEYCYSLDNTRVGLVHESYFYIWLTNELREESCIDLLHYNLPTDTKCLALGSVYAVLASNSHGPCYVMLVRNGEIILQSSSTESYFNPSSRRSARFDFFPPIQQKWLSMLQYLDFWPICLVLDYFNSVENAENHKLKMLVGMRNF